MRGWGDKCRRKEVIAIFKHPPRRSKHLRVLAVPRLPQGSTWWDLAAQGMSVAAGVRAGPGAGLGDRLWRWLDRCKCRSVQSRVYTSGGRGTGRRSLGDTVERRLPVHGHCEGEREEQKGELGTERPRQNQSSERAPFQSSSENPNLIGRELPKPPKPSWLGPPHTCSL